MNATIRVIEALERKQDNGTITFEEDALLNRLIEKVENEIYNN